MLHMRSHDTNTAKASQETRTVVEKLSIDVKPKFFCPGVNTALLAHRQTAESSVLFLTTHTDLMPLA